MYEVYFIATFRELGYFRFEVYFDYGVRYLLFILATKQSSRKLSIF